MSALGLDLETLAMICAWMTLAHLAGRWWGRRTASLAHIDRVIAGYASGPQDGSTPHILKALRDYRAKVAHPWRILRP